MKFAEMPIKFRYGPHTVEKRYDGAWEWVNGIGVTPYECFKQIDEFERNAEKAINEQDLRARFNVRHGSPSDIIGDNNILTRTSKEQVQAMAQEMASRKNPVLPEREYYEYETKEPHTAATKIGESGTLKNSMSGSKQDMADRMLELNSRLAQLDQTPAVIAMQHISMILSEIIRKSNLR